MLTTAQIGSQLESCSKWLVDNKLSFHMGKTECILFGSKRKLRKAEELSVMVIKLRHKTRLNIWDSTWTISCRERQLRITLFERLMPG